MKEGDPRPTRDDKIAAALTESWSRQTPGLADGTTVFAKFVAVDMGKRVGFRRYVMDSGTEEGRRTALLVHSVYKAWRQQYDAFVYGELPWDHLGVFEQDLEHLRPARPREHRLAFFESVLLYEARFGPSQSRMALARKRLHESRQIQEGTLHLPPRTEVARPVRFAGPAGGYPAR